MKIWKRNAVIAAVLLFICAGIYLNWSYNRSKTPELTETLSAEQVPGTAETVMGESDPQQLLAGGEGDASSAEYFAQVRLSRQQSRDSAVELLEQTIAYDEGSELGTNAAETLNTLVSTALCEAQIESLVIAKGYADCVAYMTDSGITVAVSAPEDGLDAASVAQIADIVTSQSDYSVSDIRVIEVK